MIRPCGGSGAYASEDFRPGPGGGRPMSRMADLTFVHGLVPNAEQEGRLRRLPDLTLLWATVDPLPLDEALAKLTPSS